MTEEEVDAGAGLRRRLTALVDAATLLARHGMLVDDDVDVLVQHAQARLRHGTEETVVALAGGTGSGKSTLLNAVAGTDVARAGVTRPTTAIAQAVTFGRPADALLDHLQVSRRHQLAHDGPLRGLVLLDLPDFDSVASAHRDEVDRLIKVVDLMVWVTDPQKYADQALHEGYLAPLASHADVIEVVLNKVDLLEPEQVRACVTDLRRLLAADGLAGVDVLPISATTGAGVDALLALLAGEVQAREAAIARLSADVGRAAERLGQDLGAYQEIGAEVITDQLVDGFARAAGVDAVAALVAAQHRRDATLRTGWPPVRWLRRLRRAPLTQLQPAAASTVATSEVSRTLRKAAERLVADGETGLAEAISVQLRAAGPPVTEVLDRNISRGTQELRTPPRWWTMAGSAQSVLLLIAGLGGLWLIGLALADSLLRLDVDALAPQVRGLPIPTALLLGGLLGGLLVALVAGLASRMGARRRARRATAALRDGVASAAEQVVMAPLRTLMEDTADARKLLAQARG